MSTTAERRLIYAACAILLVALLVASIAVFRQHRQSAEANAKADQLIAALKDAGFPARLSKDQVVRLFGTDGGAVCATTDSDYAQALLRLQLMVNAGSPGQRPVPVASRVLEGGRLIVQTYCPEKLDKYQQFVDSFTFAQGVEGG